ncbi:MAG: hypothetical protein Tsb005_02300 [Gammaproteobacteria bacterium]
MVATTDIQQMKEFLEISSCLKSNNIDLDTKIKLIIELLDLNKGYFETLIKSPANLAQLFSYINQYIEKQATGNCHQRVLLFLLFNAESRHNLVPKLINLVSVINKLAIDQISSDYVYDFLAAWLLDSPQELTVSKVQDVFNRIYNSNDSNSDTNQVKPIELSGFIDHLLKSNILSFDKAYEITSCAMPPKLTVEVCKSSNVSHKDNFSPTDKPTTERHFNVPSLQQLALHTYFFKPHSSKSELFEDSNALKSKWLLAITQRYINENNKDFYLFRGKPTTFASSSTAIDNNPRANKI